MWKYILKRLLQGSVVLVLVVLIISSVIYLAPVDPERLTFGQRFDQETLDAKREELGLDQPLYVQMLLYLRDISPLALMPDTPASQAKYNFVRLIPFGEQVLVVKWPYLRESFSSGRPVLEMLREKVPQTAILALAAISIGLFFGVILGVIAALKQHSWFDHSAVVGSVAGISLPSYVSAMLLALIFGYWWHSWTGLDTTGSLIDLDDFGDERYFWKNLLLPAIALGIRPIAIITQLTRSAMLEVLSQDYVRTAKAKGLAKQVIIIKHCLRNALNPVLTAASGWFAALLAGAFFVESVFNYNGLGLLTIQALRDYDIPLILGTVLFTAGIFVIVNILVDLLYALLDPRIRVV